MYKLKILALLLVSVSLLTACGMGQMRSDLAELRKYQENNNASALEQQSNRYKMLRSRQTQQEANAAFKELDRAIENN